MGWFRKLGNLLRQERLNRDIEDEMRFHLEMRESENTRVGMPPDEARRGALRSFGNLTRQKEQTRERHILQWVDATSQNLRYAGRVLRRSPGFMAVAVLSIGIGIGANTAVFSLLNGLMLKTLPVHNPQELVSLWYEYLDGHYAGMPFSGFAYPVYQDLRDKSAGYADLFASYGPAGIDLLWNGEVERVDAELVSGNFFDVLGVTSAAGRLLGPGDDREPGGHPVVVVSHRFWQGRLGGSASAIGSRLVINGLGYTVIGVSPGEFKGTELDSTPDLFIPMAMQEQFQNWPLMLRKRGSRWLRIGGRLKDGVAIGTAEAAMSGVFAGIDRGDGSPSGQRMKMVLKPAGRAEYSQRDKFSRALYVLMAAVGLVLLIACANLANLMMARAGSRHREISVRLAIGAGRSRLVAQLLTESLAVAAAGGLLGVGLAYAADSALLGVFRMGAREVALDVHPDVRVLGFTLAISILTGLLFGTYPAFAATRGDLNLTLKEDAGAFGSRRRSLARRVLVVAQVAMSLILLAGAGLFGRTLHNLRTMDTGYDRHGVLLADLNPGRSGFRGDSLYHFYDDALTRIRQIPGVEAAGLASHNLLSGGGVRYTITAEGTPLHPDAVLTSASEGYLEALGMKLIAGRGFTTRDDQPNAQKVMIVNEKLARLCFGEQNPVGRRAGVNDTADAEIIGVVRTARYFDLREQDQPAVYIPVRGSFGQGLELHVRTTVDPMALASPVRRAVASVSSRVPLGNLRTLEEQSEHSLIQDRLMAMLSEAFGLIALALAVVGLYGVLAFMVTRRTAEIGVRMALGAGRKEVMLLVLKESTVLVLAGIAGGAVGALEAGKAVKSLLFGVAGSDPWTLAGAAVVLVATALAATWLPAARAARIEPVSALRYE